jgi:hypothetical protein
MSTVNRILFCELCKRQFKPKHPTGAAKPTRGRFCSHRCAWDAQRTPDIEKFVMRLGEKTDSGCILWAGVKTRLGYGAFGTPPKAAHRFAYELANGPIPNGLHVCHRCDNPGCVNHEHLFLGTRSENMADMRSKGRQCRGEAKYSSVLTEDDVREIRRRYADGGVFYKELAAAFGVSPPLICRIVNRKKWAHVV